MTQLQLPVHSLLEDRFWKFHTEHPEVYSHLRHFAYQWRKSRGPQSHIGIKALFERVRWELSLRLIGAPKLNNNHTAFYARLLMDDNPELRGIFRLRLQKVESSLG